MRTQIRKGVFETNSSSTHAIAIEKPCDGHGILDIMHSDKEKTGRKFLIPNEIEFEPGEYGWEEETYTSYTDKASYLLTAMLNLLVYDEFDETVNRLRKWLNEEGIEMKIRSYHKNDDNYAEFDLRDEYSWYYIDHCDEACEFMTYVIATKSNFFNFLFGDSTIKTGNDNDDSDVSFFETVENDRDFPKTEEGWNFLNNHKIFYKGN